MPPFHRSSTFARAYSDLARGSLAEVLEAMRARFKIKRPAAPSRD